MKVFIWITTFLVGSIINTLIGYATGLRFGAALLYIAEYYIANALCDKWEANKRAKEYAEAEALKSKVTSGGSVPVRQQIPTHEANVPQEPVNQNNSTEKEIRYCKYCGSSLISCSEYCSNCGNKVTHYCRYCGSKLINGSEYCSSCGKKLI